MKLYMTIQQVPKQWIIHKHLSGAKSKTYNSEIEARYKQLRDLKIISVDNIYNLSTDLLLKYPISLYDLELNRWPARPSLNITSLEQILTWTKTYSVLRHIFNYTA